MRRLAAWALRADAISLSQNGFIPGEDCLEHCFMVRFMMEDTCKKKRPLHLIWFDLRNAFGSTPTAVVFDVDIGLAIRNVGCFTGHTILGFVIQGAVSRYYGRHPAELGHQTRLLLSPLIFNLAVKGLLCGIENTTYNFNTSLQLKSLA